MWFYVRKSNRIRRIPAHSKCISGISVRVSFKNRVLSRELSGKSSDLRQMNFYSWKEMCEHIDQVNSSFKSTINGSDALKLNLSDTATAWIRSFSKKSDEAKFFERIASPLKNEKLSNFYLFLSGLSPEDRILFKSIKPEATLFEACSEPAGPLIVASTTDVVRYLSSLNNNNGISSIILEQHCLNELILVMKRDFVYEHAALESTVEAAVQYFDRLRDISDNESLNVEIISKSLSYLCSYAIEHARFIHALREAQVVNGVNGCNVSVSSDFLPKETNDLLIRILGVVEGVIAIGVSNGSGKKKKMNKFSEGLLADIDLIRYRIRLMTKIQGSNKHESRDNSGLYGGGALRAYTLLKHYRDLNINSNDGVEELKLLCEVVASFKNYWPDNFVGQSIVEESSELVEFIIQSASENAQKCVDNPEILFCSQKLLISLLDIYAKSGQMVQDLDDKRGIMARAYSLLHDVCLDSENSSFKVPISYEIIQSYIKLCCMLGFLEDAVVYCKDVLEHFPTIRKEAMASPCYLELKEQLHSVASNKKRSVEPLMSNEDSDKLVMEILRKECLPLLYEPIIFFACKLSNIDERSKIFSNFVRNNKGVLPEAMDGMISATEHMTELLIRSLLLPNGVIVTPRIVESVVLSCIFSNKSSTSSGDHPLQRIIDDEDERAPVDIILEYYHQHNHVLPRPKYLFTLVDYYLLKGDSFEVKRILSLLLPLYDESASTMKGISDISLCSTDELQNFLAWTLLSKVELKERLKFFGASDKSFIAWVEENIK